MICPLLAVKVEDRSRRLENCYENVLWSRVGASNEERRSDFEGICKEDQLDRGG
jgi:hypothetical protein